MGFDKSSVRLLLYAKKHKVSFDSVITIGRQKLLLKKTVLKKILQEFNVPFSDNTLDSIINANEGYAESLLKLFGATITDSLDFSDYEGASFIHDLNNILPSNLEKKYSLVIDGGSLEHIFNFPTAIKNCMSMIKVGGHFIGITPVNNLMGHGFYQFTPELFYRIFSPGNGFQVEKMLIFEIKRNPVFYEVADPESIAQRVMLINNNYTYLFVISKRISDLPIFLSNPQQSDYVTMWKGSKYNKREYRIKKIIPKKLILFVRPLIKMIMNRPKRGFSKLFYKKVNIITHKD